MIEVAALVILFVAASAVMASLAPPSTSTATVVTHHRWTICNSPSPPSSTPSEPYANNNAPRENEVRVPPSQWDTDAYQRDCFLRRNDTVSAPGTALFQRWLSDFADDPKFDPFNDFPNWEIMRRYPDIGENGEAREYYTLWYTTLVGAPEPSYVQQRGHLTLHGVNYEPIVYFDGKLMRSYSTYPVQNDDGAGGGDAGGMFLRRHYDLGGSYQHEQSKALPLEILVLPPPFVGKSMLLESPEVDKKYGLTYGQGGDHTLAKSGAVSQFTAGWDWIQSTPDRNVGIWDRVEIEWMRCDLRLYDVHVKVVEISTLDEESNRYNTDTGDLILPLGDDVRVAALLELSVLVTSHRPEQDTTRSIKGRFEYWITTKAQPETILASGTMHGVEIKHPAAKWQLSGKILLSGAKIWWPNSHSNRQLQPLYTAHVAFYSHHKEGKTSNHNRPSDSQAQTNFGIRTVSSFIHPQTKSFALTINGHPIFLAGGNWITSDQFLRYSSSPKRYLSELTMLRHLGINSIRIWGGGVAETDHFYDTADELGMLIYQEFWMTGDNNGRWAGSYDWPLDHDAYLANARDTILRLRNHPSLCWYGGGNELFPIKASVSSFGKAGSLTSPPKDVDEALRKYISELDGRPYISSSVTDVGRIFDNSRTLAPKDGPYGIESEELFFDRNPGFTSPLLSDSEIKNGIKSEKIKEKRDPGRNIGFQTEVGSVSHPELQSLRKLLSQDAINAYPDCGERAEHGGSIHEEWVYYKYLPFANSNGVDHICQFIYPPHDNLTKARMDSIEEYSWAAQFTQYHQYKSLFEGYIHRMWEWYSAVFLWKVSSPAPTFRGALYDCYLDTNAGYYGARVGLAGGRPVNLILNLRDLTVHIANTIPTTILASSVNWKAYSLNGTLLSAGQFLVPNGQIEGNSAIHIKGSLPWAKQKLDSLATRLGLQDILFYKLGMSYAQRDSPSIISHSVENSYYLTDPSVTDASMAASRFSLLGYIRKHTDGVKLNAQCKIDTVGCITCTLHNAKNNNQLAIMTRLALVGMPVLFSDNYLSILPDEEQIVQIPLESINLLEQSLSCSAQGFVSVGPSNVDLMLSIEGWNVPEIKVGIMCDAAELSEA